MSPALCLGAMMGFAILLGVNSRPSAPDAQCSSSSLPTTSSRESWLRKPFAIVFKLKIRNPKQGTSYSLLGNPDGQEFGRSCKRSLDISAERLSGGRYKFTVTLAERSITTNTQSSSKRSRSFTVNIPESNYMEVLIFGDGTSIGGQVTNMGQDGKTSGTTKTFSNFDISNIKGPDCGLDFPQGIKGRVDSFSFYDNCGNNFKNLLSSLKRDGSTSPDVESSQGESSTGSHDGSSSGVPSWFGSWPSWVQDTWSQHSWGLPPQSQSWPSLDKPASSQDLSGLPPQSQSWPSLDKPASSQDLSGLPSQSQSSESTSSTPDKKPQGTGSVTVTFKVEEYGDEILLLRTPPNLAVSTLTVKANKTRSSNNRGDLYTLTTYAGGMSQKSSFTVAKGHSLEYHLFAEGKHELKGTFTDKGPDGYSGKPRDSLSMSTPKVDFVSVLDCLEVGPDASEVVESFVNQGTCSASSSTSG